MLNKSPSTNMRILAPAIALILVSNAFAQIGPGWGVLNDGNKASQALANQAPSEPFTMPTQRGFAPPTEVEEEENPPFASMAAITGAADEITPEIQELAKGLLNNPVDIFNYVFNRIEYDHYFGSKKGAMMTLLEGRGNSFDTSALLVALLRSAGHTAEYRYGPAQFSFSELSNWCGFKLDSYGHLSEADFRLQYDLVGVALPFSDLKKYTYVFNFNDRRGFPYTDCGDLGAGANYYQIPHVWVRVTAGGQTYEVDAAFKTYTHFLKQNVKSIVGHDRTTFMTDIGGTPTSDSVTGILDATLGARLTTYSTSMRNWIRNNNPAIETVAFTGGPKINEREIPDFSEAWQVFYASRPWLSVTTWPTTIPATFMSTFEIQAGQLDSNGFFTPGSFSTSMQMPALNARKMALTFSGNTANLQLDDAAWETFTVTTPTVDLKIKAVHPFYRFFYEEPTSEYPNGRWLTIDTLRGNQEEIKRYVKGPNSAYNFVYGFQAPAKHLRKRQEQLDKYRRLGLLDTDPKVRTEILNVMGLTWLMETEMSDYLLSSQIDVSRVYQHRFGRVAQEDNFFIDVGLQIQSVEPESGIESDQEAYLTLASLFGSAMEHGVIEQLQGSDVAGASAVKMIHLANKNNVKIFGANATNWSGAGGVKAQLDNYPAEVTSRIENVVVNLGGIALVPEEGNQLLNSWTGYGYATIQPTFVDLGISGGLKGGFNTSAGVVDTFTLAQWLASDPAYLWAASALLNLGSQPTTTPSFFAADPVEMATGAFVLDKTELSLGDKEPRGLTFSRHYHSGNRYNSSSNLGFGWTHNYDISISKSAGIKAGLGQTTSAHMSPYLAALATAADVYRGGTKTPKELTTVALIANWAVDQLRYNGVGVSIGSRTLQFVEMPDGTFEPPAGMKMTLEKNGDDNLVLRERHGSIYTFDSGNENRITTIEDQWGNSQEFVYSGVKLSSVKDCYNRTLTFNYAGGGDKITSVTDGTRTVGLGYTGDTLTTATDVEGKTYGYIYDGENRITSLKDPDDRIITANTYDAESRVETQKSMGDTDRLWRFFYSGYCNIEQDPEGGQKRYFYDERGRCTGTMDAFGYYEGHYYDGQDRMTAVINPEFEVTWFDFDADHNLLTETDPQGELTDYFYDEEMRIRTFMDKIGNETVHLYNDQHMPLTVTDPEGNVTTYTYTPEGLLHTVKDGENKITTYEHDDFGAVEKVTFHDNTFVNYTNNPYGDVLTTEDAEGRKVTATWNHRRQLLTTALPSVDGGPVATATNAYDNCGNLQSKTDARGNVTSYTWNALGKLVDTIEPSLTAGGNTLTKEYDLRDWLVSSKNSLNHKVEFELDAVGQSVAVTDAIGRRTEKIYDGNGRLLETKDPLLRIVKQSFNDRGEPDEQTDALNHNSSNAYDQNGNRTHFTNRRGKTSTFAYDDAGRMTSSTTPGGKITAMTYYGNNQLKTIKEPSNQTSTFLYNGRNLVSSKVDPTGTTTYAYDNGGNIETISEGGIDLERTWDERGRLKTFTNGEEGTFGYKYDANGNLSKLTYPGGKTVDYTYNERNQLETVTDWRNKTTTYLYDRLGRLTGVQRPNNTAMTVARDNAGQVLSIRDAKAGTLFNYLNLEYDAAGQVKSSFRAPVYQGSQNAPPTSNATYDEDNRLTTFAGTAVVHDSDGNMTSGPISATSGAIGLTYNSRNQLLSAGGVSYTYDAQGTRLTMTDSEGETRYSVDPNAELSRLLIKHNPDDTKTYYVYGIGLLYEVDETNNAKTYHYDQSGSTIVRTNDDGNVIGTAQYTPYGVAVQKTGDMDTPFLFNGEQGVLTDMNGLLHMRARYYSPYLMRFLNPDPAGFSGGTNWFSFADGNPISKSDPFGLWGWRNTISLALDFIPIVGTVKGAVEMVAGYDFIAGEDVNRGVAAAGMVAGLIPGGKAAIKGGSKMFSAGLRNADEAAEIAEAVVKNGDGFIYKRISTQSDEYIGKSKDYDNFLERQYRHDLNPKLDGPHQFEVMGQAKPGLDLNILEETWIRNAGGLRKEGGTLLNGRHEMNAGRYLDGVNQRLWDYQQQMLWQNGLLNGAVQSINRIK